VAAKDKKKPSSSGTAKSTFDPKPVRVDDESILERLKPHMAKLAIALGAAVVVIGIVMFVVYLKDKKQEKSTAKLAAVLDVAERPIQQPGDKDDPRNPVKPFASPEARANAVLDTIAKQGAKVDPTFKGSMLIDAGKLDEAIAAYKQGQHAAGLDGVLAREGLGIALEMRAEKQKDAAARQKGLEEALAAFQAMQPLDNGPRRAFALYHQGRILALLGKRAEAKAAFDKAKDLGKDTAIPQLVDERLATLGGS
jgi:hypothetical protein